MEIFERYLKQLSEINLFLSLYVKNNNKSQPTANVNRILQLKHIVQRCANQLYTTTVLHSFVIYLFYKKKVFIF